MILPRFSLRLLLVSVTVLCACCAWLGYQWSIVVRRWTAVREIDGHKGVVSFVAYDHLGHRDVPRPPWGRRLFGDLAVDKIDFFAGAVPADLKSAARIFPEAEIWEQVGPIGSVNPSVSPVPAP